MKKLDKGVVSFRLTQKTENRGNLPQELGEAIVHQPTCLTHINVTQTISSLVVFLGEACL